MNEDRQSDIQHWTQVIKSEMTTINDQFRGLQAYQQQAQQMEYSNPSNEEHSKQVVKSLQIKFANMSSSFKDVLQSRSQNIIATKQRREQFGEKEPLLAASSHSSPSYYAATSQSMGTTTAKVSPLSPPPPPPPLSLSSNASLGPNVPRKPDILASNTLPPLGSSASYNPVSRFPPPPPSQSAQLAASDPSYVNPSAKPYTTTGHEARQTTPHRTCPYIERKRFDAFFLLIASCHSQYRSRRIVFVATGSSLCTFHIYNGKQQPIQASHVAMCMSRAVWGSFSRKATIRAEILLLKASNRLFQSWAIYFHSWHIWWQVKEKRFKGKSHSCFSLFYHR